MDIGWFTGVLEAEGSISAQVCTLRNGFIRITPFIALVNTDQGILDECMKIMTHLAAGKRSPPRLCQHSSPTRKACSTIRLDGHAVVPVLKAMLPFMRSDKKRNAEVVLKYIDGRMKAKPSRNKLGHMKPPQITKNEVELICSIRTHKAAKSFEAICEAPNIGG